MIIKDVIYGEFEIEPIFEELINTKEVQRLKNIHQGGASYLVNPIWNVTRYDHSVGTMLLIRLLGGGIPEQIAGLFHDISHTAFSHVVDFVVDNKNEDYHELILGDVLKNSSIPNILDDYGYDSNDILLNHSKWSILEKSAPKLCADRIDYTLRDMYNNGITTLEEIKDFLSDLKVINSEIVITSLKSGEWFVDLYYKEVLDYFMDPLNVYSCYRLSEILKLALDLKEITLEDFLKDDDYLLSFLQKSKNEKIISLLSELSPEAKIVENTEDYDIHQINKLRLIDPTLYLNNNLVTSSEASPMIKTLNEEALRKSKLGVFIKILK